ELEFRPGITAVVGPNGSGKSNISDAVRWVLGEQSAKSLRGVKMEDIIFAGSDSRKGVNYGEVSLTLDNFDGALDLDFMEVTVTRRVYRTGDSEYFINKDSCRLKDITELFMDTGLGKEAYSIIGQGRIEEILSTKSEERRGIFEEAAGIVKYKARKREATKKLEETESNLARVHDIISELREQERPLEQQAVAAKEYRRVKDQLKNKEVGYYVYHIENVHQNWGKTSEILDELNEQRITFSTSLSQQDAIIEKKRFELNQSTQQLDELQKELLHISEDVEKLEGQKDVLLERERNQGQNRQSYEESLQLLLSKLESKQNEVSKFKSHIDKINSSVKSVEDEMTKTMTAFSSTNAELSDENIEKRKADLIEILNEMASSRNDVRHLTHSYENLERRIERLEEENDAFLKQRESLKQKKKEITDHLQRITGKLEECKEQYRKELSGLEDSKTERDEYGSILRKEENQIETLKSRLEILNDMQNDYAGFFQGVKEILKL
ncbi:MAG: AAA family ATPase, partial [Bacilli bacterium]